MSYLFVVHMYYNQKSKNNLLDSSIYLKENKKLIACFNTGILWCFFNNTQN